MRKDTSGIDQNEAAVRALVREIARDRAASLKFNINALIIISVILVTVVLLSLQGVDILIVAAIAVAGLAVFWLFTWFRGRKLEKQIYREELAYQEELLSNQRQNDAGKVETATTATPLSQRELDILAMIAKGKKNKEIGRALGLSAYTIRNHIARILQKLGVNDRTSAVVLALYHGWISNDTHE
ncbi:MAG: response regulator transcription factor [Chloroflexota bacterium]